MHPKHLQEKHQLQAVMFAAGTAALIACVERAVVVSIFRQLHMWVFLALNLLLIAILFTSTHAPPKSHSGKEQKQPAAEANHRDTDDVVLDDVKLNLNVVNINEEGENGNFEDEESDGDDNHNDNPSALLLSNEELNERAEAFISRFRQQYLVSEVKISRSSSDIVCGRAVLSKSVTL